MAPIRVLVVDDAVVVRRVVSEALSSEPDIQVVATAANGRIALQRIPQCAPDIVTLDVEMPEMDGLETLRHLRAAYPALPVIMFSTLTERGATTTLDALALGASDYITKPSQTGSLDRSLQRLRDELVPRIRALAGRAAATPAVSAAPASRPASARLLTHPSARAHHTPVGIVAIGVSTGGPNALDDLLPRLRPDLPVPVVLVQHMPPMFTRLLAERLDAQCALHVRESSGGEPLVPGQVYIAPGGSHLIVARQGVDVVTALTQSSPENSCRPAVDVLFRSVAAVYGADALAVVLTGMGQDGLRGCEDIREHGGRVLAQDEASSVVWGMPGFVAKAGLAEKVLPLDALASEINRLTMEGRIGRRTDSAIAAGAARHR
ncbi:MAG: chemotaxis response regulator protein-glutamate methylesterase [Vicinamibacterales bacterium]